MKQKTKRKTKKIKCYLAGAFIPFGPYSDWRDLIKGRLSDKMDFYDPRTDTEQSSIATFVYQDLKGVESCDMVFYFATNLGDVGSAIECERGNCKNKLVVLCINKGVDFVHPVLLGVARRVFVGIETGVAYLRNLAECGLEDEFKAIYKTMRR